jgi:hypothetical protein
MGSDNLFVPGRTGESLAVTGRAPVGAYGCFGSVCPGLRSAAPWAIDCDPFGVGRRLGTANLFGVPHGRALTSRGA